MTKELPRRDWVLGVIAVLLVATVGTTLAVQGWKSRVPFYDLTPPIDDAYNLLTYGKIPEWGRTNSLGSYSSPGSSWLLVPGVALFSDPRLFEYAGGVLLYIGTLFGVLMLARTFFGIKCAILAVVLYGLSEIGLYFAASLWPKGHPFFYVWTLYFASSWGIKHDARYLAGAVVTMAAGMYVHMEITPTLFIIPGVYILYRPPLTLGPTLIGAALSLTIWLPYLHFDYSHNFSNLVSQLRVKHLSVGAPRSAWCDQSLKKIHWQSDTPNSNFDPPKKDSLALKNLSIGLLGNFERTLRVPGIAGILLGLLTISVVVSASELFLKIGPRSVVPIFRRPLQSVGNRAPPVPPAGLIVFFLLIPWALLLYASKDESYGVETRFWWLWPVQVIFVAALVTDIASWLKAPRIIAWVGQGIVTVAIVLNALVLERLDAWTVNGWSGRDSYEQQVVDYIADLVVPQGKDRAAIGYETFFLSWVPTQHISDPRMKVGMEFDLMLRFPHKISNTSACGEGVSTEDEYRIVQTIPSENTRYPFNHIGSPIKRFAVADVQNFQVVKRFGPYLLKKRSDANGSRLEDVQ